MQGRIRSPGRLQDDGGSAPSRALYGALSVAGLALAVISSAQPSAAATTVRPRATAQERPGSHGAQLTAGGVLGPGAWLTSPNGHFRLAMQPDGNLVEYWEGQPIWASRTSGHPGADLEMQPDGNLVLYSAGHTAIWSSGTDRGGDDAYYLRLQDNGNGTVYSPAGKALWATNMAVLNRTELLAGTELPAGSYLTSPDGQYHLTMQPDGNLVLYWEGQPLWASHTAGHPGSSLEMQGDGNLVIYQGNRPIWTSGSSRKGNAPYALRMLDGGNATVYSPAGKRVWMTNSAVVGLELGDSGPAVKALQVRLSSLGYWVGTPDGSFADSTQQAVWALQKAAGLVADGVVGTKTAAALEAGIVPKPRPAPGYLVEVDLQDDLVMVVNDGKVLHILNTSTGGGYTYVEQGVTSVATTPSGVFHIYNVIDGLDVDPLGALWRPRFFYSGFAIHGDSYVPPYPVSHGCVRVSNEAIDWIWAANIMPIGTEVWVY